MFSANAGALSAATTASTVPANLLPTSSKSTEPTTGGCSSTLGVEATFVFP